MAGAAKIRSGQRSRVRSDGTHEGFLRHKGFFWLKISVFLCLLVITGYAMIDVTPRHNGGSWYGYILGTIGALLILWLTLLGIRKRNMTRGAWSLKSWTSAHVYLGLSLIVIATLHTGFQLGWNVHTLAYALMMLVILSGIWGITVYAMQPQKLSFNRDETTETQMLEELRSIDRQLHDAAQPLSQQHAELVRTSLAQNPFAGGVWRRLTRSHGNCATARVHDQIRLSTGHRANLGGDPLEKIDSLLTHKQAVLARVRRHLQIKAQLEIWLYFHIPLTFALIAALTAHVVSVFFYW